jgi:hypothetical protein
MICVREVFSRSFARTEPGWRCFQPGFLTHMIL